MAGSKVMHCGCTAGAAEIAVKSGGKTKSMYSRTSLIRDKAVRFQDKLYGNGMRVFNLLLKGKEQQQQGRCTVCGTVRSV